MVKYKDFAGHRTTPSDFQPSFSDNTCFDLASLPAELLEMVTAYLGAEDQLHLFCTTKTMYEMMTEYHWQQMMRHESPVLYKQLELNMQISWRQRATKVIRYITISF